MSTFKAALNHDVALSSLTLLDPQPRCEGLMKARRTYAASRAAFEEGLYTEWVWDFAEDAAGYQAILGFFGLNVIGVTSSEVTIYTPDSLGDYQRYNAIAYRPEFGRDIRRINFFYRGVTVLFTDLVLL